MRGLLGYRRGVTPAQLRAFATVVRLGSVKAAAESLQVSEAAVSMQVAQLRRELNDKLFTRTRSGLAFTPGGLRLASRAAEILGLQDRTVREVRQAGRGRRLLQLAASSLFAEHCAAGLIELFAGRAADLDVELRVCDPASFGVLLHSREVDIAIGPTPRQPDHSLLYQDFLNYQILSVAGPAHPLADISASASQLAGQTYFLGPSGVGKEGTIPALLTRLRVPESHQRIFQSEAAALEETKRLDAIALAVRFAVSTDLAAGRLIQIAGPGTHAPGTWCAATLPEHSRPAAASELLRFITTPRAIQAMLRGSGITVGRFKPSVHVTLWS